MSSYLLDHAISPKLARHCGVRGVKGGDIHFPYNHAFTRTRKPDGKVIQPKGMPLSLYWPLGRMQASFVLLTEGEGDCLAALSVLCTDKGEPRDDLPDSLRGVCPVGLPGSQTPSRVVCGELIAAGTKKVYTALDGDSAGREATPRICEALRSYGISPTPLFLPRNKDLSDCLSSFDSWEQRVDWLGNLVAGTPYRVAVRV